MRLLVRRHPLGDHLVEDRRVLRAGGELLGVGANLRRKQLATAAGDLSGALADKISFSDVVARFPEFVATINRLGFFEDADGNWVRRRFDANGKVVSEVKYAALPQGVLSAATAAARDVSDGTFSNSNVTTRVPAAKARTRSMSSYAALTSKSQTCPAGES